ncbi:MAG: 2-iminoacetate synthase ThiH [Candidatus Hydrogenedentota bacterium]
MSFQPIIEAWPRARVEALLAGCGPAHVEAALAKEAHDRTLADFAALTSPHARPHLEAMAREAQRLTRWYFGRTISLYAPLYISNLCAADCIYCGFSFRSGIREKRVTLTADEIHRECEHLAAHGFQNILLLTGEAPKKVTPGDLAEAVAIAREYFHGVSVEVYSLDAADYARLVDRGLEGVTLYMETYDRPTYAQVHLAGQKADYAYRLDAIERAGHAGVRKLNIGVLLGLTDWRVDAFWMALHGKHVQKTCWQSALGMSFPRLLHTPERFQVAKAVSDVDLVQLMLAMRLLLPEAGFNLSTREPPRLRDRLIPLGITHMSAGSSTRPGGYGTRGAEVLAQFELEDHRPPAEVVEAIRRAGYAPVWKDFDHAFHA